MDVIKHFIHFRSTNEPIIYWKLCSNLTIECPFRDTGVGVWGEDRRESRGGHTSHGISWVNRIQKFFSEEWFWVKGWWHKPKLKVNSTSYRGTGEQRTGLQLKYNCNNNSEQNQLTVTAIQRMSSQSFTVVVRFVLVFQLISGETRLSIANDKSGVSSKWVTHQNRSTWTPLGCLSLCGLCLIHPAGWTRSAGSPPNDGQGSA